MDELDLDAYFARIGYGGPAEPTAEVLAALHLLHPAAIVFENIDPLLGRPVRLDLGSLARKLISQRRGGYCFEQNSLFQAVLQRIGFPIATLGAEVCGGTTAGRRVRARTWC